MTTDTVLTEEQIQQAVQCITAEQSIVDGSVVLSNVNVCFLELEQAVLQSPEVQRLREDAERYRWLLEQYPCNIAVLLDCAIPDIGLTIDAAMEKQS